MPCREEATHRPRAVAGPFFTARHYSTFRFGTPRRQRCAQGEGRRPLTWATLINAPSWLPSPTASQSRFHTAASLLRYRKSRRSPQGFRRLAPLAYRHRRFCRRFAAPMSDAHGRDLLRRRRASKRRAAISLPGKSAKKLLDAPRCDIFASTRAVGDISRRRLLRSPERR